MLLEIQEQGVQPARYVREKLGRKEKVMGFGHRVYKTMDPRAPILRRFSRDLTERAGQPELYVMSEEILETMADLIVYQRRYQLWRAAMCALMRAEEQLDRLRAPALLDDELVAWHIQQLQERYPLD